ncbi:hypothetical protein Bca52824_054119 [Brassica carinata]|uniref:Uncharacterized protein n=1 Tax=Brassica carinata TaxID=52824 RepID=A0A8X7ULJ5_BRACI|nr:hypothetical protein Bca52824_054119 [Brassica carinata]
MAVMQLSSIASCGLFRAFLKSRAPPRTPAVVIGRKNSRVIFASSVNNHSKGFKEKAQDVGEKTMETVKDAWETAKSTAQKVTEAVVGSGEEADRARHDVDKGVEDLSKKAKENWKDDDDDLKGF